MKGKPEDEIYERQDASRRGNQIKSLLSKKYDHIDNAPEEKYRSFNMAGAEQSSNLIVSNLFTHNVDFTTGASTTYSLTDANNLVT